ncbi:Unknown protein [Arabidopsis thaliana]|nr:Unknown protein [Arabidopsis thaliana]
MNSFLVKDLKCFSKKYGGEFLRFSPRFQSWQERVMWIIEALPCSTKFPEQNNSCFPLEREEMDSYSSPPMGGSGSSVSPEVMMESVKTQLAQAYAEELIETLRTKCFDKCVTKPGSSLGGSESSCISRCVERYMEATAIISRSLFTQR